MEKDDLDSGFMDVVDQITDPANDINIEQSPAITFLNFIYAILTAIAYLILAFLAAIGGLLYFR